jgi:hypothetical protein
MSDLENGVPTLHTTEPIGGVSAEEFTWNPPADFLLPEGPRSAPIVDSHIAEALGPLFLEMQDSQHPHRRGTQFEEILRALFLLNGYDTERNSRIASPRQTDLLARKKELRFLVESKWKRDPVDIADVDAIKARLERAPAGTIGCFFSMSPYTKSSIERVRSTRATSTGGQDVLLVDPMEVGMLLRGETVLDDLIERKLLALRERGDR